MKKAEKTFLHFLVPPEVLEAVEQFRFENRFESRAATVIWLLQWALARKPKV